MLLYVIYFFTHYVQTTYYLLDDFSWKIVMEAIYI